MSSDIAGHGRGRELTIRFEPALLWGGAAGEDARLGLANGQIVTVLSPADGGRWYLQNGYGPCEREGLLFGSLAAAEEWIRSMVGLET